MFVPVTDLGPSTVVAAWPEGSRSPAIARFLRTGGRNPCLVGTGGRGWHDHAARTMPRPNVAITKVMPAGLFKRRPLTPVERLMAAANLPTAGGEIPVSDIAMHVVQRRSSRVRATLAVVEELLAEDGDTERDAFGFLENLQNAASHGTAGMLTTEELLPLRGARTVDGWETVHRFWAAVVVWCDANGVELETSESLRVVEHPGLRSILWPSYRSVADGRRVGLGDVLLYEKMVGVPMAGFGHHPPA